MHRKNNIFLCVLGNNALRRRKSNLSKYAHIYERFSLKPATDYTHTYVATYFLGADNAFGVNQF